MKTPPSVVPLDIARLQLACSSCSLRELCLPAGLNVREMERVDLLVNRRRKLKRSEHLYRSGAPLAALYAIRSGFMKSCVLHDDGREQVAGFHMMGELLGMDAISSGHHMCDTVALEDSEVCEIPFPYLEQLSRELPSLQQQLHRIMSREIVRDYGVMLLLGSMKAEERLAAFLLNLSQRFSARGYSANEFNLRMTREEIGSYLGLKLETISRVFSRFQQDGLIDVRHKHVRIRNPEALRRLLGQQCP
jgi:CRP/FNR family transcriptional regulator, anaerobic regulatory protein